MYKLSWGKCKYTFTPAWFTDVKIDRMKVKWNMDGVKTSNADAKEDNYLVWSKTNMAKGEKIKMNIKYDKSAFGNLNEYKQSKNFQGSVDPYGYVFFLIVIAVVLSIVMAILGGGGYYSHSGFYGGYHGGFYGGCVMSSCACACAGSGRAGCLRKDFYGTKINNRKLKKVLDSNI